MKNEYLKAKALYFGSEEMVLVSAIVGVCVLWRIRA